MNKESSLLGNGKPALSAEQAEIELLKKQLKDSELENAILEPMLHS
jgi:hypothetical protein